MRLVFKLTARLALFAAAFLSYSFAFAESHTVVMKSISYDPKTIEIKTGDSIEWINQSYTNHSATSDDPGKFETGMIEPKNHSKPIVFSQPGQITYHCSLHGKTMSGKVNVQPANTNVDAK